MILNFYSHNLVLNVLIVFGPLKTTQADAHATTIINHWARDKRYGSWETQC